MAKPVLEITQRFSFDAAHYLGAADAFIDRVLEAARTLR